MAMTRGLLLAAAVVALAAWAACGLPLHHQAAALHDHPLLGQLGSLNQVQLHGARQLREALAWPENSEDLPMHAKLRHWMRAVRGNVDVGIDVCCWCWVWLQACVEWCFCVKREKS